MLQVTTCSNGKYKLNAENVFISLPVELGADGVKRIIEIEINEEEQAKVSAYQSLLTVFAFFSKVCRSHMSTYIQSNAKITDAFSC